MRNGVLTNIYQKGMAHLVKLEQMACDVDDDEVVIKILAGTRVLYYFVGAWYIPPRKVQLVYVIHICIVISAEIGNFPIPLLEAGVSQDDK